MNDTNPEIFQKAIKEVQDVFSFIFGDKIKVELESHYKDNKSILIDGWIELTPFEDIGNNWELSTLKFIPQTYHEPEDVEINEIGTFPLHECVRKSINLVVESMYNNWCEYQSEKEMDEIDALGNELEKEME